MSLGVLSGKAPIKVSATAGTATNLSADKLDGKDSTEFLGKTDKAADAAHADRAEHATTADNATSADSATTAQNAANADKLGGKSATDFYAAGSKVADSSHADEADVATNAKEALHANKADWAQRADSATNAEKAKSADSAALAQNAQNAANANKLDGKDSTAFAADYKSTVVVSPVGTDTENGTALLDALSGITDASATKKYLLYIEPGTYDLGKGSLQMKQYVDIQGAGELNTLITSVCDFGSDFCSTVRGANNAELRFLTVRNTSEVFGGDAISNESASPRITHVTAESSGRGFVHVGVRNADGSSPTMTDVTAKASGGTRNIGVYNELGSPTIRQSKLSGSTNSLLQADGTAKIALTQLVGSVRRDSGTMQCFNNYNENLAAVTCP